MFKICRYDSELRVFNINLRWLWTLSTDFVKKFAKIQYLLPIRPRCIKIKSFYGVVFKLLDSNGTEQSILHVLQVVMASNLNWLCLLINTLLAIVYSNFIFSRALEPVLIECQRQKGLNYYCEQRKPFHNFVILKYLFPY